MDGDTRKLFKRFQSTYRSYLRARDALHEQLQRDADLIQTSLSELWTTVPLKYEEYMDTERYPLVRVCLKLPKDPYSTAVLELQEGYSSDSQPFRYIDYYHIFNIEMSGEGISIYITRRMSTPIVTMYNSEALFQALADKIGQTVIVPRDDWRVNLTVHPRIESVLTGGV